MGARVRALRKQRFPDESARAFSRRAGLNYAHLSKIESGAVMPTLPTLEKIAAGLETELQELLT